MRLNWARTARRRTKLGKHASSRRRRRRWTNKLALGAGSPVRTAAAEGGWDWQAAREASRAGIQKCPGRQTPRNARGMEVRYPVLEGRSGEGTKQILRLSQGQCEGEEKMENRVEGGGESEEKAPLGQGWLRVRGKRRAITTREGQSDGETRGGGTRGLERRNWRRVKERGEVTRMRTRGAGMARGSPACASPCRAPSLALSPAVRTHFVTITGPSLGRDCFPQIVVL